MAHLLRHNHRLGSVWLVLVLCRQRHELVQVGDVIVGHEVEVVKVDVVDVAAMVLEVYFLVLDGIAAFSLALLCSILHF